MSNKELLKLIEEYQNHRMENFHLIYEAFYKLILLYAQKVNESDAAQDLSGFLVEILFKIDTTKFKRDDSEDLKRYIAVCLRNEYYAMLKRKQFSVIYCDELTYDIPENTYNPQSKILIRECLATVTDNQRIILVLRYGYGFSDSQIAEKLHISRQAVSKTRKKGLEKLKNFLNN